MSPDEHFRSDLLIALEFPAYLIRHPNKVLWLTHHRWNAEPAVASSNGHGARAESWREICGAADRELLPRVKKIFTISSTVSYQLRRLSELDALPICPPMGHADSYCWERPEGYLWIPDRLGGDRLHQVLEAVARCQRPVRVRFGGPHYDPEPNAEVRPAIDRLGLADRVEWLGRVGEEETRQLYGRSLAVLCPARDETFPWPAFRAMLASRAVVTGYDSGAPAEIIEHDENGLIVAASPEELAKAMDELWRHPDRARALGASGRAWIESQSFEWSRVIETLLC